ncbi:MAG TPA: triose-phosphate isomerase [Clostridia bacterium]|jgi:triosephosphate isomerase|nr:MAG: triosephosphate isomerase [Firmicutes bacterium ADurb.Bin146]HOD93353.1 triose-phosphate isomerase [Clostridia bacterium]HQM39609.1 triose-phosphate isomerase [Clostridia bacterium]
MYKGLKISAPFFEIGPKAYLYGEKMLSLARVIDITAMKYDVDIIVTPQYTDISLLASNTERILVFAQHMDYLPIGRGLGSVLPEAVKAAGAVGVMLNHAEKSLRMEEIKKTIERADEVGLGTIVCSDTIEQMKQIAMMNPNLIVAEPTELIGTGQTSDISYVKESIETVKRINKDIMVLQGAGIKDGKDVYNVIKAGAMATGSTSGIIKAKDPYAMVEEMIYNLRKAWDEIHCK